MDRILPPRPAIAPAKSIASGTGHEHADAGGVERPGLSPAARHVQPQVRPPNQPGDDNGEPQPKIDDERLR